MTPTSSADCVVLVCAAPLVLSGSACEGCPSNTAGSPPNCVPCTGGTLCPGLLPIPLLSSTTDLALASASVSSLSACTAASARAPTLVKLADTTFSYTTAQPLLAVFVGASLGALALCALTLTRAKLCPLCSARMEQWINAFDMFASAHVVPQGTAVISAATPLGGTCSLLGVLTFFTFAVLLTLKFVYANTQAVSTLAVLTAAVSTSAATLPWAVAPPSSSVAGVSGVQVRIFSQAGLGDCVTPSSVSFKGLSSGAWVSAPTPSCGSSDARAVLTWACPACVFSADSSLSFTLPWSCQSLYVEALSVDASGSVNALAFNPNATSARGDGSLLSSVSWVLQPMVSVVTDSTSGRASARGYELVQGSSAATYTPPTRSLLPLSAAVRFTITMPLETTYSLTILSDVQSLTALLSSIIGVAGILSAFRILFQVSERALRIQTATAAPAPAATAVEGKALDASPRPVLMQRASQQWRVSTLTAFRPPPAPVNMAGFHFRNPLPSRAPAALSVPQMDSPPQQVWDPQQRQQPQLHGLSESGGEGEVAMPAPLRQALLPPSPSREAVQPPPLPSPVVVLVAAPIVDVIDNMPPSPELTLHAIPIDAPPALLTHRRPPKRAVVEVLRELACEVLPQFGPTPFDSTASPQRVTLHSVGGREGVGLGEGDEGISLPDHVASMEEGGQGSPTRHRVDTFMSSPAIPTAAFTVANPLHSHAVVGGGAGGTVPPLTSRPSDGHDDAAPRASCGGSGGSASLSEARRSLTHWLDA